MDNAQMNDIISRMVALLSFNPFENADYGQIALAEWQKKLLPYDFDSASEAVDIIIRNADKFPTLAEFLRIINSLPRRKAENKEHCYICNNKGYVLTRRDLDTNDFATKIYGKPTKIPILLHCICDRATDHTYHSSSIMEYYSAEEIERIKAKNMFQHGKYTDEVKSEVLKDIKSLLAAWQV